MTPTRLAAALCAALATAECVDTTSGGSPYVRLNPVLDSLFVGDRMAPPAVTYYDPSGVPSTPAPGSVQWSSSDTLILAVNPISGSLRGVKRGVAFVVADVQGVQGVALVVVSNTLDLTLLLDTIYAMPRDTLTVPVAVRKQSSPPPAVVWYQAPTNAVYKVDSASGVLTAVAPGGPIPYFVHADTLVDTGAVYVLTLNDTTGGKFFFSVVGTVITHVGGPIRAVNYRRSDNSLAFRLRGTYTPSGTADQVVQITLRDSVITAGRYAIDSMSPAEALQGVSQPLVVCTPPRPWALWSSRSPSILSYSRRGGMLVVTQLVPVPNGNAISGHFLYRAQRVDFYTDSLGVLTVQGSFVAPLVTDRTSCQ